MYPFGSAMCFDLVCICWYGVIFIGGGVVCGWVRVCVGFVLVLVVWY